MAVDYPESVRELVSQLRRLPSVGPRSAERMAVWFIQQKDAAAGDLASALNKVETSIESCKSCGFFADDGVCAICTDTKREEDVLCVVEQPTDVLSIERTGQYRGLYHVLGGKLSPLENVAPEDLRIDGLAERLSGVSEVILALASDVEGEATAHYLAELLDRHGVKVTQLAQGMPAGGGLDHTDPLTLMRALNDRRGV